MPGIPVAFPWLALKKSLKRKTVLDVTHAVRLHVARTVMASPRSIADRTVRRMFRRLGAGLVAIAGSFALGVRAADDPFWKDHVEPVIRERCGDCHSGVKTKSGLDLGSFQSILRGGDRGAAVVPGRPDDSLLLKVLAAGADPHMPPKGQLTEEQIGLVKTWIGRLSNGSPDKVPAPVPLEAARLPKPAPVWIPPASMEPSAVIDRFIELGWTSRKVSPARAADDSTFLRRIYLDLVGRVPSEAELRDHLKDRGSDRRQRWVDGLLADPAHPRHLAEVFDVVMMGRRGGDFEEQRRKNHWTEYLEASFRENRPWNRTLHDLIVGRPQRVEDQGAVWFLYERKGNPQAMAEAVAPLVFGLQIKCAQCHDHMIAREIKQAHYWGMVAAFNRTKNVDTPAGPGLAESAIGGFVSFANLKKESQPAALTFFNGRRVDEPWPKDGEKEVDDVSRYLVPPPEGKAPVREPALPKFSRRSALAQAVTEDNPLLARAMVNRVWAMLLGRGLVHPVDLMDSKHLPSHPDLLDWLARDFAASGHDVRRLVRNIVLTRVYQLDSRPAGKRPPLPDAFATGPEKPLSAEQLYHSLTVVTANTVSDGKVAGRPETDVRRAFVRQFPDLFAAEYNASLQQALFLSNSPLFDSLLEPREGTLCARLAGILDARNRAGAAIQAVYGRKASAEELKEASHYLTGRDVRAGTKQLLWALLTSAEFQTNH